MEEAEELNMEKFEEMPKHELLECLYNIRCMVRHSEDATDTIIELYGIFDIKREEMRC